MKPADRIASLGVTLIRRFVAECPPDALSLGLGQLDLPVPGAVARAASAAARRRSAGYGANAGNSDLRALIGAAEQVEPSRVIVTVGVEEALALAILGTVNPGDEVVVPDPAFPVYANLTRIAGGTPVTYRLEPSAAYAPTWAAIKAALSPRTKMVVVCSPGNPTGAIADAAELRTIAVELEMRGIIVLSDEIYRPFVAGSRFDHGSFTSYSASALVAGGLSKSVAMAGWRLGWLIVPPSMVEPLTALHQHLVTSASTLVQSAAVAAFSDESQKFVARAARMLLSNSRHARRALLSAGFEVAAPAAPTMYVWARLPGVDDELALARRIANEARVVVIPGRAFGDGGRGHVRISLGVPSARLRDGIDRIASWANDNLSRVVD